MRFGFAAFLVAFAVLAAFTAGSALPEDFRLAFGRIHQVDDVAVIGLFGRGKRLAFLLLLEEFLQVQLRNGPRTFVGPKWSAFCSTMCFVRSIISLVSLTS